MTGNDRPVADFICRYPQTFQYLKLEEQLLDFLVPQYINEGKAQLVISVGCTGGQHRSVLLPINCTNICVKRVTALM